MPYERTTHPDGHETLSLWPHRSLPKRGFAFIVWLGFVLAMIPMFPLIGSVFLWVLLPFALIAPAALWFFIEKSYRDGEILEELSLWPDHVTLHHHGPHGQEHSWEANPHWVKLHLYETGGPVKNYLTLKGAGREVELGAFLSEDERPALFEELRQALILAQSHRSP